MRITQDIRAAGGRCFLVGGWVRDHLMGREDGRDYDIEVYHLDQETLISILQQHGRPNLVGKSFGVIHLVSRGIHYDFSFPRLESKVGVGHRAFKVETSPNLDFKTAASRRDFTINAMGMELPDFRLEDPYHGLSDLKKRLLRHVGPAFAEDSLRVLRAIQFAARFNLSVAPETVALCRRLDLSDLSSERIYEEFRKWLLKAKTPSVGLYWFRQMQLDRFFPQISCPPEANWDQWGEMLDGASRYHSDETLRMALMFSVLAWGCADRQSLQILLSQWSDETALHRQVPPIWEHAPMLRAALASGLALEPSWLRRYACQVHVEVAVAWTRAQDSWAQPPIDATQYEQLESLGRQLNVWNESPQPLLTGKMLISLGLKPGPHFGTWIQQCFERQLDGLITSSEQALQWARTQIELAE